MGKNGTSYCLLEEQETTIQYSRVNDHAIICTSDTTQKTRFDKLVANNPEHWRLVSKDALFNKYICTPKSLISTRGKVTHMSPENKKLAAERMRKLHSKD